MSYLSWYTDLSKHAAYTFNSKKKKKKIQSKNAMALHRIHIFYLKQEFWFALRRFSVLLSLWEKFSCLAWKFSHSLSEFFFFFFNAWGSVLQSGKSERFYSFFVESYVIFCCDNFKRKGVINLTFSDICNLCYYAMNDNEKQK